MISGNLNFLEPSGTLPACNGIALPLPLPRLSVIVCLLMHHALKKQLANFQTRYIKLFTAPVV